MSEQEQKQAAAAPEPAAGQAVPATDDVTVEVPAQTVAEQGAAPRRGGQGLALVALLVAAAAAAGTYFLWQRLTQWHGGMVQQEAQWAQRLATLEAGQGTAAGRLDELAAQVEVVRGREQSLTETLEQLNTRLGHDQQGWILAEADYLLRIAARRLQLERDVAGAIAALNAADQRLLALGDPALVPVRERISEELQALHGVAAVDLEGIALELGALAKAVDGLSLAAAPPEASLEPVEETSAVGDWRGLIRAVWTDIKGLVVVRRHAEGVLPLAAPDQRLLLTQNLRLKLETARLALLQGRAGVYRAALTEAGDWLAQYFDGADPATRSMREAVARLAAIEIAPPLPVPEQSLRQLRAVGAGQPAAAEDGSP